jgi:hypothetical protein
MYMLESPWCGVVSRQEGYVYWGRAFEMEKGIAAGWLAD